MKKTENETSMERIYIKAVSEIEVLRTSLIGYF